VESDWSFLTEFAYDEPTVPTTWADAIALSDGLDSFEAPLRERLAVAFERSNGALSDIGGDPLRENWTRFRPLRLGREEDWSDWLGWLLETSATGRLAGLLFGREATLCCTPLVDRELIVEPYRLDLRIRWSNGDMTTLEVKIGDRDFEKTGHAAMTHRHSNPGTSCDDWILMLQRDFGRSEVDFVRKVNWDAVAKYLRFCLRCGDEALTWRVWGRAFAGCIEQDLLGYSQIDEINRVRDPSSLLDHLEDKDEQ
jgi:hypothetical protein